VIYGGHQDATLIALEPKILVALMHDPAFKTNIFEVEIGGKKQRTMAWTSKRTPCPTSRSMWTFAVWRKTPWFACRSRSASSSRCCAGIKVGGVLNIVRHDVEVRGKPDDLPITSISISRIGNR